MTEKKIVFLLSFDDIELYLNAWRNLLTEFDKEFTNIYFVNSDYLKIINLKSKNFSPKKIKNLSNFKIFNPKSIKEFNNFIDNDEILLINNTGKGFNDYLINFNLNKKNITQFMIANTGNLQASVYYFMKYNLRFIYELFVYYLPRKLTPIFYELGIFKKIDVRFESNKKITNAFDKNRKKRYFKRPTIYKKMVTTSSRNLSTLNKKKISKKIILFLDMEPDYRQMKFTKISDEDIKTHYLKISLLLKKLEETQKKKVIVSIHPLANLKKVKNYLKNFQIIKFKTQELITQSDLILFFDTSAIVDAIFLKKKIICLRSKIFYGKRYNSDLYKDILKLKSINIDDNLEKNIIQIKKNKLKKVNYNKYLKTYGGSHLIRSGEKEIIKYIKKNYF